LTLVATTGLTIGLVAGGAALFASFVSVRFHALDSAAASQARTIATLAQSQRLPRILPVQPGQLAQVLTSDARVISGSSGTSPTLALVTAEQLRQLADGRPDMLDVAGPTGSIDSRVVAIKSSTVQGTAYAVVAAPTRDERATIRTLARLEFAVVPALVLIFSVLCWQITGRSLRTVDQLRAAADAIRDPAARQRLPVPSARDEVHALATTLNAMLDRMSAANERERSFVADAAHELRSPIASMRTQLEVALAHPVGEDWPEVARGAVDDLERLARIVDDLLALVRLEAGATRHRGDVDLAALAGTDDAPVIVVGDAAALERALRNLRDNAIRHARERVEVSVRQEREWAVLTVDDDGPGVPLADRSRIFDRFTRLDSARSRDAGGSGLGLAIARATAQAHGGDITVGESPWGGASFVLRIPAKTP
jgi:signal transduction histidine kinase